jgi:hypothetical protein
MTQFILALKGEVFLLQSDKTTVVSAGKTTAGNFNASPYEEAFT